MIAIKEKIVDIKVRKLQDRLLKVKLIWLIIVAVVIITYRTIEVESPWYGFDYELLRHRYDIAIAQMMQGYNGTGCEVPTLEPYSSDTLKLLNRTEPLVCNSQPDWVKCHFSVCKLQPFVLETMEDVDCDFKDLIHIDDYDYKFGPPVHVNGENWEHNLVKSDQVEILCTAWPKNTNRLLFWKKRSWFGYGLGLRRIKKKEMPKARVNSINILMLVLDSMSRARFEYKLPHTYRFLREKLNATCLDKYNVVGDGTHEAIIPIFTGKRYFEMNDFRKKAKVYFDLNSVLFYKLNQLGYRTAYFEDSPYIGTFTSRYTGFDQQPTDHYLRSFFREIDVIPRLNYHCIGATKQYQLMIDLTDQMMQLDGKKFTLTFISDITHDPETLFITSDADRPLVEFLDKLMRRGHHKDTLIIVMGDHGSKFGEIRQTYNGAMEERLPFMAIRLPEVLKHRRPFAQKNLENNAQVLTTPHDIHTTLVDALNLPHYTNNLKLRGATLKRGLSLIEPIPKSRSCGEAGITSFWCTCLRWDRVPTTNPIYFRLGHIFVEYINNLTRPLRNICAIRTLLSTVWVKKVRPSNMRDITFWNNYFVSKTERWSDTYKVLLAAGPDYGLFEGTARHNPGDDSLDFSHGDISRINAYGSQANCVRKQFPHLNPFCFCTV